MLKTRLRRSGAPIRRHSREAGREGMHWQRFNPRDVGRFMLAAERFERRGKLRGRRNGPLGHIGLEVLRELLRLVDYKTGRLDPSLQYLGDRLKRSKDAIVRALAALRRHGFIDWIRRWRATGDEQQPVAQTSNAYRLVLPPIARALLGLGAEDPPAPDDDTARREQRAESRAEMFASMAVTDRTRLRLSDNSGLAAIAAKMAARLFPSSESTPGGEKPGKDSLKEQ